METRIVAGVAQYRLVYVQPDPENGDRVCVGIVFNDSAREASLLYDPSLAKLRCVAPEYDFDLLGFYLEDLRLQLNSTDASDQVLKRYTPSLAVSEPRLMSGTLTNQAKQMLLDRFARGRSNEQLEDLTATAEESGRPPRDARIKAFVQSIAPHTGHTVIENARLRDLFEAVPTRSMPRVAVGLVGANDVIIVDGVDLASMSPGESNTRAEHVVRTFWKYNRYRDETLMTKSLYRVGVVMNGSPVSSKANREAHDYAFEQLKKESDLTVDTSIESQTQNLQLLLASRAD